MNIKSKPKLVRHFDSSFATPWMTEMLSEHFDLLFYQEDINYHGGESKLIVFVDPVRYPDVFNKFAGSDVIIVIDGLWERKEYIQQKIRDKYFVSESLNWFWYNESFWHKYRNLHGYQPNRTYQYRALMPMRLRKAHRDVVHRRMTPYLDDFVWSYVAQGRCLPNDSTAGSTSDRHFHPDWYDSTCFSLVVESCVEPLDQQPVFVTEKTFKPMAFQHPFMIFGNAGTLKYLKSQGFETYENLFDESYDVGTPVQRLKIIEKNVQAFEKKPYDKLTCDKIRHNHNRFFDTDLARHRIITEIINPILEHAKI
jgi:hypothetical protein